MMNEIEKARKMKKCNSENFKELDKNFKDCLKNNNNKVNLCQLERYKYEACYQYLKFINQKNKIF